MPKDLFDNLYSNGFISDEKRAALHQWYDYPKTNLATELRSLLYLGVLLLTGGIGVYIYTHLEQLGPLTIAAVLILLLLACLVWSARTAPPFSWRKTESPNAGYDYVLLLAGLLVPIIAVFLQTRFNFFGNRWGLASFVPMIILFALSYYFDHQGILSLAIGNLAAWLGISIKPSLLLDFDLLQHPELIVTAFALGVSLLLLADLVKKSPYKRHFNETYRQFGIHLSFLGALAGLIENRHSWAIWYLLLLATGAWQLHRAFSEKSSYLMVTAVLYLYIGTCYVVSAKLLNTAHDIGELYLNLFYYLFSGIAVAILINRLHQKLKAA
ncbi:MAG: DUF2157 domain-containing protein [Flavihumibacter sp.]